REVVVVRGNLDFAGAEMLHRMISAMVSELQLESFSSQRQADELMPQAYAENGHLSHQLTNALLRIAAGLGIARSVRQENSVRLETEDIFGASFSGNHSHFATFTP